MLQFQFEYNTILGKKLYDQMKINISSNMATGNKNMKCNLFGYELVRYHKDRFTFPETALKGQHIHYKDKFLNGDSTKVNIQQLLGDSSEELSSHRD